VAAQESRGAPKQRPGMSVANWQGGPGRSEQPLRARERTSIADALPRQQCGFPRSGSPSARPWTRTRGSPERRGVRLACAQEGWGPAPDIEDGGRRGGETTPHSSRNGPCAALQPRPRASGTSFSAPTPLRGPASCCSWRPSLRLCGCCTRPRSGRACHCGHTAAGATRRSLGSV